MSEPQILWLYYAAVAAVRIFATSKRLRLPKIRGGEYFFNLHVGPAFYSGPGRAILAAYRRWILLPWAIDAVAVPLIITSGSPRYLVYLMFGGMIAGILIYVKGATRCAREAKRYALDSPPPAAQVSLSLTPRRARDYTNWTVEAIIAAVTIACLIALIRSRPSAGEPGPFFDAMRAPLLIVYLQLGALLIKRAIVAWRAYAPSENAEQYLAWREGLRRRYLFICDAVRLVWTLFLAILTLAASVNVPWSEGTMPTILAIVTLIILAAWCVWYNRYTRRVVADALAQRPVNLPGMLEVARPHARAVCYRPATPLSFIRTDRGFTLNLASRRTQIAALYLCGLIALIRW